MGPRSGSKVPSSTTAAAASRRGSTLEQLESLRCFVPADLGFTEADLTNCLRQCGFNTQLAAERLITGVYKKQKGERNAFFKMTASSSPARKSMTSKSNSSGASSIKTSKKVRHTFLAKASSNKRKNPPSAESDKKEPPRKSPSSVVKNQMIDLSLDDDDDKVGEENQHNKATAPSSSSKPARKVTASSTSQMATPVPPSDDSWLLCQRWISDAVCTTRRGAMDHQEEFSLEASGPTFLRLRGRALEGRFPDHIGRLLNPLVRENLVYLRAHALMKEENLPTGASIPVSLSVHLPDPLKFFQVFPDSASVTESSTNMLWTSKAKGKASKRKASSLEQAAFDLLQWAQYGDVPDFSAERANKEDALADDDEGKGEELNEEDFENAMEEKSSELAKEFSDSMTGSGKSLAIPEADDPEGFRDVELRPYQKQALHWMRQREVEGQSREEQEEQLRLLAELAREKRSTRTTAPNSGTDDIFCDCGPVQVSDRAQDQAQTCDGVTNPVSHPLWERRFLTDPNKKKLICFFVNKFMGIASHQPASPPRPCSGGVLADAMGYVVCIVLRVL